LRSSCDNVPPMTFAGRELSRGRSWTIHNTLLDFNHTIIHQRHIRRCRFRQRSSPAAVATSLYGPPLPTLSCCRPSPAPVLSSAVATVLYRSLPLPVLRAPAPGPVAAIHRPSFPPCMPIPPFIIDGAKFTGNNCQLADRLGELLLERGGAGAVCDAVGNPEKPSNRLILPMMVRNGARYYWTRTTA
jgi:hypothetical protein